MTKRSFLISALLREARAKFLISVRGIVGNFLALFRGFPEQDACALLSAYGLYALELARFQNDRLNEQKETNGNFGGALQRTSIDGYLGPLSIGVHPDIMRTKRTNSSQNHAQHRYRNE